MEDPRERHLTDDNSFLRQTLQDLRITLGKREESGKILEKDLWVRAHSKETPLKDLRENAPVELNVLNEIIPSKELERMHIGNANLLRYLEHSGIVE